MKRFGRREAGDTIVEVLVAIVIVATILGGAYATANHSLLAVRESQEHGEALNIAEGQLEILRNLAINSTLAMPGAIFKDVNIFCFPTVGGLSLTPVPAVKDVANNDQLIGDMPTFAQEENGTFGPTPSCVQNPQTNSYSYDVAIDRCDTGDSTTLECAPYYVSNPVNPDDTGEPPNSALFIVHVCWDSTSGSLDEVLLQYRVYEGQT